MSLLAPTRRRKTRCRKAEFRRYVRWLRRKHANELRAAERHRQRLVTLKFDLRHCMRVGDWQRFDATLPYAMHEQRLVKEWEAQADRTLADLWEARP
jgi:predicted deacetylase